MLWQRQNRPGPRPFLIFPAGPAGPTPAATSLIALMLAISDAIERVTAKLSPTEDEERRIGNLHSALSSRETIGQEVDSSAMV